MWFSRKAKQVRLSPVKAGEIFFSVGEKEERVWVESSQKRPWP